MPVPDDGFAKTLLYILAFIGWFAALFLVGLAVGGVLLLAWLS
jgi:hypothetical protein